MFSYRLLFFVFLACVPLSQSKSIDSNKRRSIQQRIVGGEATTIENYPFAALVLYVESDTYLIYCGGSILTSRTILSAAHCFYDEDVEYLPTDFAIRVGSTYAYSGGELHFVNQFVIHENYDENAYVNDIAIVQVKTRITFSNLVAPIVIPSTFYNLPDNTTVTAVGWGTIYLGGPTSEQLRTVNIYTVSREECSKVYGSILTDDMLCTGDLGLVGDKDTCLGDSGGPLIHNGVVVGVTSWGIGCATPGFPGVYARVSVFSRWIMDKLMILR